MHETGRRGFRPKSALVGSINHFDDDRRNIQSTGAGRWRYHMYCFCSAWELLSHEVRLRLPSHGEADVVMRSDARSERNHVPHHHRGAQIRHQKTLPRAGKSIRLLHTCLSARSVYMHLQPIWPLDLWQKQHCMCNECNGVLLVLAIDLHRPGYR